LEKKKIALAVGVIISALHVTPVYAAPIGLLIEPALTYEYGSTTIDYPSPFSTSKGNANGFGFGAKGGVLISGILFAGLEGRYSMPQYKDSANGTEGGSVSTNWGPMIGVQMPIVGLRVWGAYILGGELNPEKRESLDVAFKKATGYRLGTGFRIALVSLNLEYQKLKYGETELEEIGPFVSGTTFTNVKLENSSWIASVSFPIGL
jgi:hypothetical protein